MLRDPSLLHKDTLEMQENGKGCHCWGFLGCCHHSTRGTEALWVPLAECLKPAPHKHSSDSPGAQQWDGCWKTSGFTEPHVWEYLFLAIRTLLVPRLKKCRRQRGCESRKGAEVQEFGVWAEMEQRGVRAMTWAARQGVHRVPFLGGACNPSSLSC